MVLTKWIVPEPNPDLKLSIDTIDYKKLDYQDLRWIYSTKMKKYYREFCDLKGFVQYAERVFYNEDVKRELMQICLLMMYILYMFLLLMMLMQI